jgi:hypothetical protein
MAPRNRFPKLTSLQAGGWGLPGTGIRRPDSAPLEAFDQQLTQQIRPGEGTATGIVPAGGEITLQLGPDGLSTWYVSYVAISTTTGALDTSTAAVATGPAVTTGLVPAGQAYNGGGDSVGLAGAVLTPGEYVIVTWTGGHPGDQATMRVYGNQTILT